MNEHVEKARLSSVWGSKVFRSVCCRDVGHPFGHRCCHALLLSLGLEILRAKFPGHRCQSSSSTLPPVSISHLSPINQVGNGVSIGHGSLTFTDYKHTCANTHPRSKQVVGGGGGSFLSLLHMSHPPDLACSASSDPYTFLLLPWFRNLRAWIPLILVLGQEKLPHKLQSQFWISACWVEAVLVLGKRAKLSTKH